MGRKKGQVFSAEFKTRIVLELLEGVSLPLIRTA